MQQQNREYDVVVLGASGFTGRLVVEYLLENYPPGDDLRWAIAGRNPEKLQQLLDDVADTENRPPVLIADSHDRESLDRITTASKVILTTVGPYAKYGSELVEACVRNGTHYCDLCGEVQWMRQMIDQHQAGAEASGARIVMSCGFDSIPSDMGVWFLQEKSRELHGETCDAATLLVRAMKGGASGGTYASMLHAIEQARSDRNIARILTDPYALNPKDRRGKADERDQRSAVFNPDAGTWTAPFVMAGVNTRVVRRSHALEHFPYGESFRYHEATMTGRGFPGRLKATAFSAGLTIFMLLSAMRFTRESIVRKILPDPGEGPSRDEREAGYFNLLLLGRQPDGSLIRVRIKGDRDPGYGSTSKMLAESAICLAMDEQLTGGGLWTPSTAMGSLLMRRLTERAGLSFELE